MRKRLMTVIAGTIAVLMLTSSAALAHVCFNASRSANGTQGAAASPAWWSLGELIEHEIAPELCAEGVEHVVETVDPDGEFATHARTVLASGQQEHHPELSGDGRGIDHVFPGHTDLVADVEAALGEAFTICATA